MSNQYEIEAALHREWKSLREEGVLSDVLPSMATRQWMRDSQRVGYVTLDYQLSRHVELPGARGHGPAGVASLLERYWSVRTRDGRQDPQWLPSLNVNVVHVRPRAVTGEDVEELLRNAMVAQRTAYVAGKSGFQKDEHAKLYVRAVLLGQDVCSDVELLAEMWTLRDVEFRAAQFRFSVAEGFTFNPVAEYDRFSEVGLYHHEQLDQLGEQWIGDDVLPTHGWAWTGENTGAVYDHATGLTVHDGRVL